MHVQTLLAALEELPLHIDAPALQGEVTALAYDSRTVTSGALFIAVPGTHTDGRRYIRDAAQRGAIAELGEALEDGGQQLPLPYIAVRDVRTALANLAC